MGSAVRPDEQTAEIFEEPDKVEEEAGAELSGEARSLKKVADPKTSEPGGDR